MFEKKKTIQKLLSDAGLSVPGDVTKAFNAAVERFRAAKLEHEQAQAGITAEETSSRGFEGNFAALKEQLASEITAGAKGEAEVMVEIRAARERQDMADVRISGLRRRVNLAESERLAAAEALNDAGAGLRHAVSMAVQDRFIAAVAPFCSALRRLMAVNDGLRVDLRLYENKIIAPLNSFQHTPETNLEWIRDTDAAAISDALDPIRHVLDDARAYAIAQEKDPAREMRAAQARLIAANERACGTAAELRPATDPRVMKELGNAA